MTGVQTCALPDLATAMRQRISLIISDAAIAWLSDAGFDPAFGARPLNACRLNYVKLLVVNCRNVRKSNFRLQHYRKRLKLHIITWENISENNIFISRLFVADIAPR